MCTASNYITENHYFGRNFDYEISYNERVTVTPRNYVFKYRKIDDVRTHYAIIGIAAGIDGYPLYYDACNEKGLAIAGLNFAGNAVYQEVRDDMVNITPFELIPYLLGSAASVGEARKLLEDVNLVNINFADELPLSPLHWMMSDNSGEAIVIEPLEDGLKVYDNPAGVLTNNPPFDKQLFTLNDYRSLSNRNPENTFSNSLDLDEYSRGMGAIGLPGDLSSSSRFAKVAFTRANSYSDIDELSSVGQFFHILKSVEQQNGCTFISDPNLYEYTIYTSCGLDGADHDRAGFRHHVGRREADGFKDALVAFAGFGVPAGRAADVDAVALFPADKFPAAAQRLKDAGRKVADEGGAVGLGVQKAPLEARSAAHGRSGRTRGVIADANLAVAHDGPDRDDDFISFNFNDFGVAFSFTADAGKGAFPVTQVKTPVLHGLSLPSGEKYKVQTSRCKVQRISH